MDIYDAQGQKIAHLLHYLPKVKDGDVILVKTGKQFGLTEAERAKLADTITAVTYGRVRVLVVDESTTATTADPREIRAVRAT